MPLADVRFELENELRDSEADALYREMERKISDALFDATELATIADVVNLEVQTVKKFARVGGEPFGSNQAAIDAIFDDRVAREGEISEIIELDANRAAVFKVTGHYEAARQPIEMVRELIVGALKTEKGREIARAKTDELLSALADGAEFGGAATAAGALFTPAALLGRQAESPDQAILAEVFSARKPRLDQPTTGTAITAAGEYAVFSIDEVMPGRPESVPLAERDAGKTSLTQQSGFEDYAAFVLQLQQYADVAISDDALEEQDFF
jgi:peptidyl-prolyl cis-trans isomerase D